MTPLVVGILNVTPDSFSDGGRYQDVDAALAHAEAMVAAGAAIIDLGGESTRPGAAPVDSDEERRRVVPILRELVARDIAVSIDTMNARTAWTAVELGAQLINDVSGGLADKAMPRVVAETGVPYIAMHWRGGANASSEYRDVVSDVRKHLKNRIAELIVQGVSPDRLIIDPGLGFAKTAEQNWALLGALHDLTTLGHPVLIGASRKRFLADLAPEGADPSARDEATATISALAAQAGVWAVRVHDVASTVRALEVARRWAGDRA